MFLLGGFAVLAFIVLKMPGLAEVLGNILFVFNFTLLTLCFGTFIWAVTTLFGFHAPWWACTCFIGMPFGFMISK